MYPTDAIPAEAVSLILFEEISHRVINEYAQAVAYIGLAAAEASDLNTRTALLQTADRLRHFASAHRVLQAPLTVEPTNLTSYLQEVCVALSRARLLDMGVHITLVESEAVISAQRCWRVGLIVSELITNAARHAFRGRDDGQVRVEVWTCGDRVCCRVTDNGRPTANPKAGRGCTVATALAADLQGTLDWRFEAAGTVAELAFPLTA